MEDDFIKISLGKGIYKNIHLDDIFADSDSGDENYDSDIENDIEVQQLMENELEKTDFEEIQTSINENNTSNICELENISDPDELLNNLLDEFDKSCVENDVVPEVYQQKRTSSRLMTQKARSPSPKPEILPKPKKNKSMAALNQKKKFGSLKWKKGSFLAATNDLYKFKNELIYSNKILELQTPYEFFKYFFTDNLLKCVVEESNIYAFQQNKNKLLRNALDNDVLKYFDFAQEAQVVYSYLSEKVHPRPTELKFFVLDALKKHYQSFPYHVQEWIKVFIE